MPTVFPPFGSPQWYGKFLDRLDRVTVQIAFTDHPSQPAREVFVIQVDEPGWERDWLTSQVLDLFWDEQGTQRYPNQLRITQTFTGWGAAGAGEQLLLLVGHSAIAGTAASASWAAMQALARALLAKRKDRLPYPPMDRETAEQRGRQQVEISYGAARDTLTLVSDSQDVEAGSWEIHLEDPHGIRYEVILGALDGEYGTLHLTRKQGGNR